MRHSNTVCCIYLMIHLDKKKIISTLEVKGCSVNVLLYCIS